MNPDFEQWMQDIVSFATTPSTERLIALGVIIFLVLMFIVMNINRRTRKKRAFLYAPQLFLESFQVSPMGKDAYLKIGNMGSPGTLTQFQVNGRQDLLVKNQLAGHKLERGEQYRILLEAAGSQKINSDFTFSLTYMDARQNVFQQEFDLRKKSAQKAKLLKLA
jgi:hypothetical protein